MSPTRMIGRVSDITHAYHVPEVSLPDHGFPATASVNLKAGKGDRSPDIITPRDVAQHGPYALRETAKAKEALKLIADHGWLLLLEPGTEVDGKARQIAYRIIGGSHVV